MSSTTASAGGARPATSAPDADAPVRLGAWTLRSPLAAGATGVLFQASGPAGAPPTELHLAAPRIARDSALRELYLREARAALQLRAPGLAEVREVSSNGVAWCAISPVDGVPIAARLARARSLGTPMPLPVVHRIARAVAEALQTVHDAGLVHGRLSASRVLLAGSGGITLVGWFHPSLSQRPSQLADNPTGLAELAPEQLDGLPATPATDVYHLALLVLTLIGLGNPLVRGTFELTHREVLGGAHRIPEGLAPALADWTRAALSREPADRPALSQALEALGVLPVASDGELGRWLAALGPSGAQAQRGGPGAILLLQQQAQEILLLARAAAAHDEPVVVAPPPVHRARRWPLVAALLVLALIGLGLISRRPKPEESAPPTPTPVAAAAPAQPVAEPIAEPTPAPVAEPTPAPVAAPVAELTPAPAANAARTTANAKTPASQAAKAPAPASVAAASSAPPSASPAPAPETPAAITPGATTPGATTPGATTPGATTQAATTARLVGLEIDSADGAVSLVGRLEGEVRPTSYLVDGDGQAQRYVIWLPATSNGVGLSRMPVASRAVRGLTLAQDERGLTVTVQSGPDGMGEPRFTRSGDSFTVTIPAP